MADDIIDRLRCAYRKGEEPPCEACTFCAARAEVERLREIAEAAAQYHDVACNPDWCRLCRAISSWKEARRG